MTVCKAKTQISLGVRPGWFESLLCTQWVAKDPSFLHADSEDPDQTGQTRKHFVGFVTRQLKFWLFCKEKIDVFFLCVFLLHIIQVRLSASFSFLWLCIFVTETICLTLDFYAHVSCCCYTYKTAVSWFSIIWLLLFYASLGNAQIYKALMDFKKHLTVILSFLRNVSDMRWTDICWLLL